MEELLSENENQVIEVEELDTTKVESSENSKVIKEYFLKDDNQSCMKDLADLFGQSQGEMSKEFGVFKAKKLYKKLNYLVIDNTLFYEEFLKKCNLAVKHAFKSVTVLPSMVKKARQTLKNKGVEVRSIIDYPLGEETLKTKLCSLKTAIKNGVDGVLVCLSTTAIKNGEYKKVIKEFKKIKSKAKKRKVSVVIDFAKLSFNEVKPIVESLLKECKIYSVIPCNSLFNTINYNAIKDFCELGLNGLIIEGAGGLASPTEIVTAFNNGAGEILSADCPFIAEDLDGRILALSTWLYVYKSIK